MSSLVLFIGVMNLNISGLANKARPPLSLFELLVFFRFLILTLRYPGILKESFLSLLSPVQITLIRVLTVHIVHSAS